MADRRVLLLVSSLALGGCTSEQGLLLDHLCRQLNSPVTYAPYDDTTPCRVSGDAQQVSGMTADTIGFRLGPGGGALHIRLDAIEAVTEPRWSLDVLAASTVAESSMIQRRLTWGSCPTCPTAPGDVRAFIQQDPVWIEAIDDAEGVPHHYQSTSPVPPKDAELSFHGANIAIFDLRSP